MIPFLFLLMLGNETEIAQSHRDSLIIYKAYKESIQTLKNATDPDQWYAIEDSLSRLTACSFLRLSQLNKQSYHPVMEYNKEGMGVAYGYPEPSDAWLNDLRASHSQPVAPPAPKTETIVKPAPAPVVSEQKYVGTIAFSVLDHQTHFMVSNNGKTKTPYIEMNYYAKGRILVKTEKLNPITLKPIEIPQPEVKPTALVVSTE